MGFKERYEFAVRELEAEKIGKRIYCPPVFRLFYQMGFSVPPPHYNAFIKNALLMAGPSSLAFWLFMFFIIWRNPDKTLSEIILIGFSIAILFGILMASHYKSDAKKHKLTPWDEIDNA